MIDTGSKNGFIKNSLLVLKNEELNAEKFENWIKNQLLQNIKEKSVIILDNAPIHSKQLQEIPSQKYRKQYIID
jgi:prophage antirepressor-like protein